MPRGGKRKGAGRPKKKPGDVRSEVITFRVTPGELRALEKRARELKRDLRDHLLLSGAACLRRPLRIRPEVKGRRKELANPSPGK